jgi:dynein heavy chain
VVLLPACLQEYDTFQIEIAKGYGQNEWREDLKKVGGSCLRCSTF